MNDKHDGSHEYQIGKDESIVDYINRWLCLSLHYKVRLYKVLVVKMCIGYAQRAFIYPSRYMTPYLQRVGYMSIWYKVWLKTNTSENIYIEKLEDNTTKGKKT